MAREDEKPAPIKMANPELVWVSDEDVTYNEGCLSLPEHYADVARPKAIRVRYLDHQNEIRELEAEGLLATCIQHEMDHLDGVLFVDHITALKRNIILRKLLKAKKTAARWRSARGRCPALRLAFMGTPDFAAASLAALMAAGHDIVAVYSQPPRPAGRGQQPRPSPVQQLAESHGLPVVTPTT